MGTIYRSRFSENFDFFGPRSGCAFKLILKWEKALVSYNQHVNFTSNALRLKCCGLWRNFFFLVRKNEKGKVDRRSHADDKYLRLMQHKKNDEEIGRVRNWCRVHARIFHIHRDVETQRRTHMHSFSACVDSAPNYFIKMFNFSH